jgi:hypothetical protein
MRTRWVVVLVIVVTALALGGLQATASGGKKFAATLSGYEETPTLSVPGIGTFSARLGTGGTSFDYTLTYDGLSGPATQAHIHLGQPVEVGGVIAFLCGGGGQDPCPGASGSVSGSIDATHVIGPAGQGIDPGEFEELVAAMRAGATYANVHTAAHPGGEIRGRIG